MYLLKIASGKETIVGSVFLKYGLEAKPTSERGFLISEEMPSFEMMEKVRTYIHEVVRVEKEEAEKLLNGKVRVERKEIKELVPVEIVVGNYTGFRGIVRKVLGEMAIVDLNVFGKATAAEVPVSDIKILPSDPWA